MGKLDNWHKTNGNKTVLSHFIGAAEAQVSSGYAWARAEEEEEKEDQPLITEREVEELSILENLVVTTQKKIDITKKQMDNGKRPEANTAAS